MLYDCILINGDSYSAEVTEHKVYGNFLAEKFNIPIKNFAVPGSNNQRILRTLIEYLYQVKSEFKNPLVIIGWTFTSRLEVWYYGNNKKLINQVPDAELSPESRLITLDRLIQNNEATLEHKALISDEVLANTQFTNHFTNLYLLANLLNSMSIDYRFFSAADNAGCNLSFFPHLLRYQHVKWVLDNPKIYELNDFSLSKWAKENDPQCTSTGHLSESGHERFASFFNENVIKV